MTLFKRLKRNQRGAAVIEIAIALAVLITFIYGIFQMGTLYQANAGMQHALGEAFEQRHCVRIPASARMVKVPSLLAPGKYLVPK